MPNKPFIFKEFVLWQKEIGMKVGTDGILLGAWTPLQKERNILDVGTGTGLLALMLAQRQALANIIGVEIADKAFQQACLNVAESPWEDRLFLFHQKIQDFATSHSEKFDLIISNPPYFHRALAAPQKERRLARQSDTLPMSDLLSVVLKLLNPKGRLSVIYPSDVATIFIEKAHQEGLFLSRLCRVKSRPHLAPIRYLMLFQKEKQSLLSEEISIFQAKKETTYSEAYRNLTKDFYLYK